MQGVHLVLHEGNEGRDDDGGRESAHRRQLVTERFSAPCREHDQYISPVGQRINSSLLRGTKGANAKLRQHVGREDHGHSSDTRMSAPPSFHRIHRAIILSVQYISHGCDGAAEPSLRVQVLAKRAGPVVSLA